MPDGYLNTKSDLLLLHLQSSTPSLLLLLISHHLVLLSTACPTSLASEPNIRGGAVGCTDGTGSGAAFGGIDNDQPEIKARQRHRARLDPKPRYPSKDFHHKEFAKKLRDGFRGLREKRKELNHNFKGNTEGNSYVSRRPLLQVQRTRCAQFFLFCLSLAGGRTTLFKRGSC